MSASPQVTSDDALTKKPRSTNPLSKFSTQIVIGLIVGIALGFTAAAIGQVDGQPNWLTATLGEIGAMIRTCGSVLGGVAWSRRTFPGMI